MSYEPEPPYEDSHQADVPPKKPPVQPGHRPWENLFDATQPDLPPESDREARTMAMLCHLLGAFFSIVGPLVLWAIKKDESRFVDDQGKEAINFHLTLLIGYALTTFLWLLISVVTCGFGGILFLPAAVSVAQVVLGVIAGIKANEGEYYRYPCNLRVVK